MAAPTLAPSLSGNLSPSISDNDDGAAVTYQSVLGPLVKAMWHSQLGIAKTDLGGGSWVTDTWTDQIANAVLPAPSGAQRPPYMPDDGIFGGKSVVQTAITGSKILFSSTLSGIAASGTRPWLFAYGRFRDSAGTNEFAVGAGGILRSLAVRDAFGNFAASDVTTVNVNSGVALNFVPHSMECWADGTNLNLQLDAVKYSAAYALDINTALTNVCVGASCQYGDAAIGNYSAALIIICSAYPGAATAALIRSMAAAEFPP